MTKEPFDVVFLSSVDWSAARQRHHAFASGWAKAGHRVFFVENTGFREPRHADLGRVFHRLSSALRPRNAPNVPPGIHVISPLVLPPTRRVFREANASLFVPRLVDLLRDKGLRPGSVVFAYLPTATTLALLDHIAPKLVVYDNVDNFYGLPSPPPNLAETETALIARSGLVLTTSSTLYDEKKNLHDNVVELHHGTSPAFFLPEKAPSGRPRLCYFGTIWNALDYAPIRALANDGYEIELIGPVKTNPPPLPRSVKFTGPMTHEDLPRALSHFDAILLPYVNDEYNRGVIPAKTYECLATGLPVLTSPLPALASLSGALTICREPEDWVKAVKNLDQLRQPEARQARIAIARAHEEGAVFNSLRERVEVSLTRAPNPAPLQSRKKALLSGLSWIGFLFGAAKASTLLTQLVAGRLLGPLEFGRANLIIASSAYLQIPPMLGFPIATSKLVSEEHDPARLSRLISTALAAFIAWSALCLPLLALGHRFLESALGLPADLFTLSIFLSMSISLNQVVASPLLGLKRFAHRGLVETFYGICAPLLLLLLIVTMGRRHESMILTFCLAQLLGSFYALWLLRHHLTWTFEPGVISAIGRYAATATLTLLAAACVLSPARLILNQHSGAAAVGLFSAYFMSTVQVAMALQHMLQAVLVPMASDREGQRETWSLLKRWLVPAGLLATAVFFVAAIAGLSLFGKHYPLDAVWAATFALAATLVLLHGAVAALFAARDYKGLRVSVTGALIAGLGNFLLTMRLTPIYGVLGAALSLILSFSIGLVFYAAYRIWENRAA